MRLQVYLSRCGAGSRRACETLIEQGRVRLNGEVVTVLGTKVEKNDIVELDGKLLAQEAKKVYIALNKPPGYLCSNHDNFNRPLAADLVKEEKIPYLHHVGRLDFLSSGLIFYTNDGEFTRIVTHPSFEIDKQYLIETHTKIDAVLMTRYLQGIIIDGERYKAKKFRIINDYRVLVTLIEGKNRELRSVFRHFGWSIRRIHRVRIGKVNVKGMKIGDYRNLNEEELAWFWKKSEKKNNIN